MTPAERDAMIARLNTLGFEIAPAGQANRWRIRGAGTWTESELELVFAGCRGGFRLAAQRARDNGQNAAAALYETESNWPPAPAIPDGAGT